jgi:hypothetical protein
MTHKGRNPLAPRLQRGMDIRHMTLAQYRYFRGVGLGGQLPDSQASNGFRGRAPLRNRAAADLALSTGMRPEEWSTVLLRAEHAPSTPYRVGSEVKSSWALTRRSVSKSCIFVNFA